jgi:alcohol dehydrogenase
MLALVFNQQLQLTSDYPTPVLRPGEAIIRPHLVGICHTDIEITRGYKGFTGVPGHEFVGTVVECADRAWIGRRVVGEINAACRACTVCARGDESHCPNRTTLGINLRDGAMAERFSLPIACLHTVPADVPDAAAVFVEPLAAALEIAQQTHIRPTDRIAVVGDGKLGLLCAQVLRLTGGAVSVVGRHPERWDLLARQGIATVHTSEVAGRFDAAFDLVVDCTGNPGGLATARRLVRPRGRLALKSTFAAESQLNLSELVVDEIQLLGSRCGPFEPALRLLARDLIETEALIADRFPLHEGVSAFRAAERRLKILLEV